MRFYREGDWKPAGGLGRAVTSGQAWEWKSQAAGGGLCGCSLEVCWGPGEGCWWLRVGSTEGVEVAKF